MGHGKVNHEETCAHREVGYRFNTDFLPIDVGVLWSESVGSKIMPEGCSSFVLRNDAITSPPMENHGIIVSRLSGWVGCWYAL